MSDEINVRTREEVFTLSDQKSNRVVLPLCLYRRTEKICKGKEKAGQLVCKVVHSHSVVTYVVEYIAILQRGEINKVELNKTIIIPKEDYVTIDFHTHCDDPTCYSAFSERDIQTFSEQTDRDYHHILYTPTHILTYGSNTSLNYVVVDNTEKEKEIIFANYLMWEKKLCELL